MRNLFLCFLTSYNIILIRVLETQEPIKECESKDIVPNEGKI